MTISEAVELSMRLLKEMKENPERMPIDNYPFHGSLYAEDSRFTREELIDAIKEHEEA